MTGSLHSNGGERQPTAKQINKKYKLMDKPELGMKSHSKEVKTELRPERREGTNYLKS